MARGRIISPISLRIDALHHIERSRRMSA